MLEGEEGGRKEARLRRACGRTVGEMEREAEGEICHLLSVPPAPLSCILPGGKYTLMSEGDRGKRMSEVAGVAGWGKANRGGGGKDGQD